MNGNASTSGRNDEHVADAAPLGPAPLPLHRQVIMALEGEGAAVRAVLADERLDDLIGMHRIGPALFLAARGLGLTGDAVERCHRAYVGEAARWLVFRAALDHIGAALDAAGVTWMPFKGIDTAERFFPRPELRPMSDVDVLVPTESLEAAMTVLEADGWVFPSTPLIASYQRQEGYNWKGSSPHGANLELHYRLWGMMPGSLVEDCWRTAVPAPDLGRRAFRLDPSMALVVSAVHAWRRAAGPQLVDWWEMKLIAGRLDGVAPVVATARRHGLQLTVGLAADHVAQLWESPLCAQLGRALLSDLRLPERVALRRVRARGVDTVTLELLATVHLFARRPSRMGWRAPLRRLWPHPGTVEQITPSDLPWWRRRILATGKALGIAARAD